MKAYIDSHACITNRPDDSLYTELLKSNGFTIAENPADADVIIFNTCAYRKESIESCLSRISTLESKKKPGSKLVVTGCMTSIAPERLTGNILIAKDANDISKLLRLKSDASCRNVFQQSTLHKYIYNSREKVISCIKNPKLVRLMYMDSDLYGINPYVYHIRIASGCLDRCSYCSIKKAKGNLKSRNPNDILAEYKSGIEKGFRRFNLLADDTGCYGMDIGTSIAALLKKMEQASDSKIILNNFNPRWLLHDLDNMLDAARMIEILCLSIQSGSNRILARMNRNMKSENIIAAVEKLREKNPSLVLKAHIMVGFPSEDDDDFAQTLSMLNKIKLDKVKVFEYSDMPGTMAESIKKKLSADVIRSRARKIRLRHNRLFSCLRTLKDA